MVGEDLLEVDLVLSVSRLGDADLAGWWSSHGLSEVGEYVLSDLFPNTWRSSALQLSMFSAAKRHIDFLPDRSNIVHLFSARLGAAPRAQEFLAELKTGGDEQILNNLQGWRDRDVAESTLNHIAGPKPEGERIGNALRLGVLASNTFSDPEQRLSATRLLAASFIGQTEELLIPYFDVVQ